MKILIIRFSSIGDIVLTTPVIRCIKQQLNAEIHYLTKPSFAQILRNNPYVDKVHVLKEGLLPFQKELRLERYDHIVDLHNNFRSSLFKLYLRCNASTFPKLNLQKYLLVNFKIDRMPALHIVDRYMLAAQPLGVKNDGKGLDYFIPEKDDVDISALPESHQHGYVAVVAGATYATKRLPHHKLAQLCEQIEGPIIVLGGKDDADAGKYVEQHFKLRPDKIYNACGKFNLDQSASLVSKAKVVYAHDTGLMHIASAFKKKIYTIWGNTVPQFGMYPYATEHINIEHKTLSCRPCSKIGYDKCPKGHFRCMEDLTFEE